MRIEPECIRCMLNLRFTEIINSVGNRNRQVTLMTKLLENFLRTIDKYSELTLIESMLVNWLYHEAPEIVAYYDRIKKKSIDQAKLIVKEMEEKISGLSGFEKFLHALKISVAGNMLDIGVYGYAPLKSPSYEEIMDKPLAIDHSRDIYTYLAEGGKVVLWIFDNAGEAVYDTLLISVIREMGNRVVGVARDDPGYANDLTLNDAIYAGLDDIVDEMISSGSGTITVHLDRVSRIFMEKLESADLVVSKGMANYEYLSTIDLGKPVAYLLIAKCNVVARSFNVPLGSYVAYFKKPHL